MSDQDANTGGAGATPHNQTSGDDRAPQRQPGQSASERGGRERGNRRRHSGGHQQPPPQQQQSSRRPGPSLDMEELRELVNLIASGGFTDFELEREGFRVRLRRDLAPQAGQQGAPASHAVPSQTQPPPSAQAAGAATGGGQSASTAGATTATGAAQPADSAAPSADESLHVITSPIVGTFYRSPSPTAEPFVRLGSQVSPDSIVCIIEAMKLMNEIQAETSGEVAKIYVENGQPVEYGQPLFGIKK